MTKYFYIEESPSKLGVIYVRVSDSTEIRYGRSREEVQKSGGVGVGVYFVRIWKSNTCGVVNSDTVSVSSQIAFHLKSPFVSGYIVS